MRRGTTWVWIPFLALAFIWGTSYLWIKVGLESLPPLTLVAGRLVLGAAFVARVAAGLEPSMDGSRRWARTGARYEPDPVWAKAAAARYRRFEALGPGS